MQSPELLPVQGFHRSGSNSSAAVDVYRDTVLVWRAPDDLGTWRASASSFKTIWTTRRDVKEHGRMHRKQEWEWGGRGREINSIPMMGAAWLDPVCIRDRRLATWASPTLIRRRSAWTKKTILYLIFPPKIFHNYFTNSRISHKFIYRANSTWAFV